MAQLGQNSPNLGRVRAKRRAMQLNAELFPTSAIFAGACRLGGRAGNQRSALGSPLGRRHFYVVFRFCLLWSSPSGLRNSSLLRLVAWPSLQAVVSRQTEFGCAPRRARRRGGTRRRAWPCCCLRRRRWTMTGSRRGARGSTWSGCRGARILARHSAGVRSAPIASTLRVGSVCVRLLACV